MWKITSNISYISIYTTREIASTTWWNFNHTQCDEFRQMCYELHPPLTCCAWFAVIETGKRLTDLANNDDEKFDLIRTKTVDVPTKLTSAQTTEIRVETVKIAGSQHAHIKGALYVLAHIRVFLRSIKWSDFSSCTLQLLLSKQCRQFALLKRYLWNQWLFPRHSEVRSVPRVPCISHTYTHISFAAVTSRPRG